MLESEVKNEQNFAYKKLLEFLDIFISIIIIAPCVICYWRGTWNLVGDYLLPWNPALSAATSFTFGVFGHLIFTIFQNFYQKNFHPDKHRLTFYIISRIYTYIFGVVCINGWRGAWMLADIFTGFQLYIVILLTLTAVLLLGLMQTIRNLIAAPFAIITDNPNEYFEIITMFKTSSIQNPGLYTLDCIFSILIVGTLVVIAWRGIWVIFDLTLYPENKFFSSWGSLAIGLSLVLLSFGFQPIIQWSCDRLHGVQRIILADTFMCLSFVATVNIWRGIWHILDLYFLPDNRITTNWITHCLPFLILTLLNCSNSLLVRGIYIDGDEPGGECVIFPIFFIRSLFERAKTKKTNRIFQSLEKRDQSATTYLLDKSTTITQNSIKIVKQNNIIDTKNNPQNEIESILRGENEKITKNNSNLNQYD